MMKNQYEKKSNVGVNQSNNNNNPNLTINGTNDSTDNIQNGNNNNGKSNSIQIGVPIKRVLQGKCCGAT
jgi:hypothetical protein